ncbi:hypothetical protein GJ496_007623 [Pomphorhynchus laevis]|nr:hypothetical protein GJ496_007623 [Pomphorhynchus laevis]
MDDTALKLIEHDNTDDQIKLKRNIGVWTGMSIVVGSMIGSGIFVSTKGILLGAGSIGLSLIIWLICGIVAILGSLVYVELGCMLSKAGGDYEYINQAFGSIPSFLFVWSSIILILPATNAIAGLTFSDYVLQPFFNCESFTPNIRIIMATLVIRKFTYLKSQFL